LQGGRIFGEKGDWFEKAEARKNGGKHRRAGPNQKKNPIPEKRGKANGCAQGRGEPEKTTAYLKKKI